MAREPVCVRRALTAEEADLIAAWLDDQGIKATVMGHDSFGRQAFGVTDPEGVGVFVTDEAAAQRAAELLAEHDKAAVRDSDRDDPGTVSVTCDGCGSVSAFPPEMRKTTQACPHCGGYVDVPEHERLA